MTIIEKLQFIYSVILKYRLATLGLIIFIFGWFVIVINNSDIKTLLISAIYYSGAILITIYVGYEFGLKENGL
jgi:hypothetical protein